MILYLLLQLPFIVKAKKKRGYDLASLGVAYKAVKKDDMSIYKAAWVFVMPEITLRDRQLGL